MSGDDEDPFEPGPGEGGDDAGPADKRARRPARSPEEERASSNRAPDQDGPTGPDDAGPDDAGPDDAGPDDAGSRSSDRSALDAAENDEPSAAPSIPRTVFAPGPLPEEAAETDDAEARTDAADAPEAHESLDVAPEIPRTVVSFGPPPETEEADAAESPPAPPDETDAASPFDAEPAAGEEPVGSAPEPTIPRTVVNFGPPPEESGAAPDGESDPVDQPQSGSPDRTAPPDADDAPGSTLDEEDGGPAAVDPAAEAPPADPVAAAPAARAAPPRDPLDDLAEDPSRWDFFAAIRRIAAAHPETGGVGRASRVEDEPLRIKQIPTLRFEPAPIRRAGWAERGTRRVYEVAQVFFGPFGPRGALPIHVTEDAMREARAGRPWMIELLDLFTHRMAEYFYRVWESTQMPVSRELGRDDPYPGWINSLFGAGPREFRDRDALPDDLRRYAAGPLAEGRRSSAALEGLLEIVAGAPVEAVEFAPEWLMTPSAEQSRLGVAHARLGREAALGPGAYSVTSKVRVRVGPLSFARFEALLPSGAAHLPARDAVRSLMGLGWSWEMQLVLDSGEAPPLRLDGTRRLGWDSWTPALRRDKDPEDVRIDGTYRVSSAR